MDESVGLSFPVSVPMPDPGIMERPVKNAYAVQFYFII